MEEVDDIIIHSLRQIGCDIDEEVLSLSQFSSELVVEAAVRCLEAIQPGRDLPLVLPANMAHRYRVTAAVADACTELGYRGDIGYQTFLYSNETDIRRVLMFLIERLPKESDKTLVAAPADRAALLEHNISQVVAQQMKAQWLPFYCKKNGARKLSDGTVTLEGQTDRNCKSVPITVPHTQSTDVSQDLREYWVHTLPSVPEQTGEALVYSIIAHNSLQLIKQRKKNKETLPKKELLLNLPELAHIDNKLVPAVLEKNSETAVEIDQESRPTETVLAASKPLQKVTQIEQLLIESDAIKIEIEQINNEMKSLHQKMKILEEETAEEQKAAQIIVDQRKIVSRSHSLLENSDENLEKLQAMAEAASLKLVKLSEQWEDHKAVWVEKYKDTKQNASNKVSESQEAANNLKTLREKHKELLEQINIKKSLHEQLSKEYEFARKDVNRSAYTRRIMEIIGNIGKQKADLERILNDTKDLQKEINTLSGRLERSFTVADELIFKNARKDEYSRRAYKFLATLHSDCSNLVSTVEATGAAIRETRDLEEQLQTEQNKKVYDSFQKVQDDLQSMKHDSAQLIKKIQEKTKAV